MKQRLSCPVESFFFPETSVQEVANWFYSLYTITLANPHVWGFLASVPFIIGGLVGTVFPALPGTALILGGFLVYGLITGFDSLSAWFFIGQTVFVILSYLIEFLATAFGVKMFGGSKAAAWGAVLGSLLVFVLGPIGIIVGPLLGAIAGELIMGEQVKQALHSGFGSFLGFMGGVIANLVISGLMIAWFIWEIL
ncbi:MAG: DUF456 family protein [Candidatus Electrothrix sp. AW5]|nr:DUF456 family protein [Candidatus Electrothrix gigas]MCI5195899.1 DUF456 family protein [Candidatus Electrothrix gigas]